MYDFFNLGLKTPKQRIAFYLTFLARFLEAFLMFPSPLFGWLLSGLFDYLDAVVLDQMFEIGRVAYTRADKVMDLGVDLVMLGVSIKYGSFLILLFLLLYRITGQIVYWRTEKQWVLIFFPNFFESYWLWSVLIVSLKLSESFALIKGVWGLVILMILKILHEVYNHYIYPKYLYSLSMRNIWKPIKERIELIRK